MRTIDIETDVFAAIWAARKRGEDTENEILSRILGANLSASEGKVVKRPNIGQAKIRWVDDIVTALESVGGAGFYSEIYQIVRDIRSSNQRSIPISFEEVVRKEIEIHSSDSDAFQGREDLFCAPKGKGAGYWELRKTTG